MAVIRTFIILVSEPVNPVSRLVFWSRRGSESRVAAGAPAKNMSHHSASNARKMVVVISTVEGWSSFRSLLQDSCGDKHHHVSVTSLGSNQVCDLTVHGRSVALHYAHLEQHMTEEAIGRALDGSFKSCTGGVASFLLLIQGGFYTKREMRLMESVQTQFGAEALKFLVILSLEDGKVAEVLHDSLLDLIHVCEGRYCRITSSASDKLQLLLEMTDHSEAGYTEAALAEVRRRSTEDSAMKMLREKVQEAEEKEQAFQQLLQQQEERRTNEMEELKSKHAEDRRREAAEKQKHEVKRESLEEAVRSHRAMLHLHNTQVPDDDTKQLSVVLLGLSGSGKSSALNVILERVGKKYCVSESGGRDPPQPTTACERKVVFAAGRQLVLVDTPELWDEDGAEHLELVKDCLALSRPGPHVFLLVLQVGRFTQGESEMLAHLQKIFGREFAEHAVVLFVRLDANGRGHQTIDDYVAGAHATLQDLVRKCGSRYYELNVTKSHDALSYPQLKELLSGMNKLVASHGGHSYSGKRFPVQELQERKKGIEERKEGMKEGNYLLREA